MIAQKKVFFVIVNYNGEEVLEDCLRSVFSSEYLNFEVVVVDNASSDASMCIVKKFFPKAHCLFQGENRGFAGGSNVGIRFALEHKAEYIFLLNNDAIIKKDTIAVLARYAKNDPRGVFSPLVLSSENPERVWFCGGHIDWFRMRATHRKNFLVKTERISAEYLSGCALFIPKGAFYEVGLLDEEYFLYYEDADWCFRAREAGYRLWVVTKARVIHTEQSETKNPLKIYFLVLSGILFFHKNAKGYRRWWLSFYLRIRIWKNRLEKTFHLGDSITVHNVYNAYADFRNGTSLHYYRSLRER